MRKTITKFECDNCNAELTRSNSNNEDDFPWNAGWIELNNIDIGAPKNSTHRLVDQPHKIEKEGKEFCSKKCLLEFIDKEIRDASYFSVAAEPGDGRNRIQTSIDEPISRPTPRPTRSRPDNQPYSNPNPYQDPMYQEQPQQPQQPQQPPIFEEKKKRKKIFGVL